MQANRRRNINHTSEQKSQAICFLQLDYEPSLSASTMQGEREAEMRSTMQAELEAQRKAYEAKLQVARVTGVFRPQDCPRQRGRLSVTA